MANTYRSTIWVDFAGHTRQTILQGTASLADVVDALLGHTVGGISYGWEAEASGPTAEPSTGSYGTVADWVQLVFSTGVGSLVRVTLPAPNADIFMADNTTVDPSTIVDVIAEVLGVVCDNDGNVATAYVAGTRQRGSNKEYAV